MTLPEPSFEIEEIVYHRISQQKGIVIAILYRKRDMLYDVSWGANVSGWAYDFELSKEMIYDTEYDSIT